MLYGLFVKCIWVCLAGSSSIPEKRSLNLQWKIFLTSKLVAWSFWAAKSDFCSIMQKFLHDEKKYLQLKNFFHFCQNPFFYTTFDIQSFWKVHEMGFKNFCMVRENFCRLQKSAPLILQPRKTPLLWWTLDCQKSRIWNIRKRLEEVRAMQNIALVVSSKL